LLSRWTETLKNHRDRPAIFEADTAWSFRDLAHSLDERPEAKSWVLAQGSAFEIAVATLQGWRDGQAVLPVERREQAPLLEHPLPAGIAHLKRVPSNTPQPRFAVFSAEQLAADGDRLVAAMKLEPSTPHLAAVSLAHSYGYSSIILPLLLHGIPVRNLDVPFPASVVRALRPHTAIHVPAVPSMWRAWHRAGILQDAPIRLALSAGAPLSSELEQAIWLNDGLKIHNFYGTSECGGISWDPTDEPRQDPRSLGQALPDVEVSLDTSGQFTITSSSVAHGYLPSAINDALESGTFHTPDTGHFSDHGAGRELILDLRSGEHINVAGRKLGPGRIETTIQGTGLVERAKIFGLPSQDPERVDDIAVLLPAEADVPTLRRALANRLAGWQLPRHWIKTHDPSDWSLSRSALREKFNPA
ncbi:MAG: AMP-binding protein, partial [Verrucomicrobiales bacterium]